MIIRTIHRVLVSEVVERSSRVETSYLKLPTTPGDQQSNSVQFMDSREKKLCVHHQHRLQTLTTETLKTVLTGWL